MVHRGGGEGQGGGGGQAEVEWEEDTMGVPVASPDREAVPEPPRGVRVSTADKVASEEEEGEAVAMLTLAAADCVAVGG